MITTKEMEDAYRKALLGSGFPSCAAITCEKCNTVFLLVKGEKNSVCEHLEAIFKKYAEEHPESV